MEEHDKFGVLLEGVCPTWTVSIQFERVLLDPDLRARERGRRRSGQQEPQGLSSDTCCKNFDSDITYETSRQCKIQFNPAIGHFKGLAKTML